MDKHLKNVDFFFLLKPLDLVKKLCFLHEGQWLLTCFWKEACLFKEGLSLKGALSMDGGLSLDGCLLLEGSLSLEVGVSLDNNFWTGCFWFELEESC